MEHVTKLAALALQRMVALAGVLLVLIALALIFSPAAHAQSTGEPQCLPRQEGGTGTAAISGWSGNGWWAWWWCPHEDGRPRLHVIIGTPEVALRNIGDRLATIRNSGDKLAAARASWRRHVTRPIGDPAFDRVRPDFIAHLRATPNGGR